MQIDTEIENLHRWAGGVLSACGGVLALVLVVVEFGIGPLAEDAVAGGTDLQGPVAFLLQLVLLVTGNAVVWYLWLLIAFALYQGLLHLQKRLEWSWGRWTLVMLLLSGPIALLHLGAGLTVFRALPVTRQGIYPIGYDPFETGALYRQFISNYGTSVLFAGFCLSGVYMVRWHEQQREASRLRTELAEARLQILQSQLQPHFLFNTLNGISALVRESRNRRATEMLTCLGRLLRKAMRMARLEEMTLQDELEFITDYVELQNLRLEGGLDLATDVSPDVRRAAVPPLLLQPLVENAIKHGLVAGRGRVRIATLRENGRLRIRIEDDGPGFGPRARHSAGTTSSSGTRTQTSDWLAEGAGTQTQSSGLSAEGSGIGLQLLRSRLERFDGTTTLSLSASGDGGARIEISLPYREVKTGEVSR